MSKILKRNNLAKYITALILGLIFLLLAAPGFTVEADDATTKGSVSVTGSTVSLSEDVTLDSTWIINGSQGSTPPTDIKVTGVMPRNISTIDLNGHNLTITVGSNGGDGTRQAASFEPTQCGLNIAGGNVTIQNTGSSSAQIQVQGEQGNDGAQVYTTCGIVSTGGTVTISGVTINTNSSNPYPGGGTFSACVVAAGGNVVINNGSDLVGNPAVAMLTNSSNPNGSSGNITVTGSNTEISNLAGVRPTGSAYPAISARPDSKGTINIEDGTISNASSSGSGNSIGVPAIAILSSGVTVNVSGGLIQGSKNGGQNNNVGDGISNLGGILNMTGGIVSGYGPVTLDPDDKNYPPSSAGINTPAEAENSARNNISGGTVTSNDDSAIVNDNPNAQTTITDGVLKPGNGEAPVSGDGIKLPPYSAEDKDGNTYYSETVQGLNDLLEANGVNPNDVVYKPAGDQDFQIPEPSGSVSSVSLGDQFLTYYQLANSQNAKPNAGLSYNVNNLGLTILPTTAFANSLEWEISSLSGNNATTPEFPDSLDSSGSSNWETGTNNNTGQQLMSLTSEDGAWSIQQIVTKNPNNPKAPLTPGNTYLCYNGDGVIKAGLYELTASAITGRGSDSIRFIVTENTVKGVNIVKPQGQGNPVTFDINQTQSYDFEFETTPQDAPANVIEWKLTSSGENSGFPAGDYAYVNPETGNVTFLQATPPGVYLTLSVSVNGVESSNNLVIELTGEWKVEEGIAAYSNPVTAQSNQAYNLVSNVVATPTYVPIGNPEFLTFVLRTATSGVILTPAGRLIPQNTNYSGVVPIKAEYDDGVDSYTINFDVIFTPRAVAATGVTATPGLEFTTGSQVTQNVMASLLPKGSVQESGGYTPGTTATVTPDIFEYRSTDTSVAVVDSYGNVRAVTEGTADIITTLKNADQILTVPSGQQLSDIEEVGTSVTVTSTPTQVPATGITATPDEIYLAPAGVSGGNHEQTVTVTLTPENTTDSVTAESGSTNVATVTGEGTSFTISAVSDGNTTVTFTAGTATATVPVSVNSEEIISSGLTYSANSPDTFSITAGGVMVNPAIPSLQGTRIDNVTFMAWSGPDQGDMQTFTVNSPGNESFSSGTFTVNGNDHYFYNADNIFVEAYANNSQVYLGSFSPNYDWINTSTAGSSDTVAYITYQENNGFNTPTAFNGAISGVTGKNLQLEGIRVSSGLEGVDVVTDVHLQDLGWVEAVNDGVYAGTQHQARQMEAIRLRLVGDNAINYDIWAQGHVENTGWMQPVKLGNNVDFVGTTGKALQLEAVKIRIVPKGQTPGGWEAYN